MLALHEKLVAAKTANAKTAQERQNAPTDRQQGRLVYDLYGLTLAEIKFARPPIDRLRAPWQALAHNQMSPSLQLPDVVALTEDLPERGLLRGQVGTVVEALAPGVFEVEFCDDNGRTYAMLALRANQLMVLRYRPLQVA